MFCENCGKEIKGGAGFCSECGAKIETDGSAASSGAALNSSVEQTVPNKPTPTASNVNVAQNGAAAKKSSKGCIIAAAVAAFIIAAVMAIIIFLLVVLFACSSDLTYQMGETAELDGLEISVTSFDTMYSIAGDSYMADDGMVYAVVGVSVYNDDSTGHSFMDSINSYADLIYEDKEFSITTFWNPPSDVLNDKYLSPMVSADGFIVFQIPEIVAENEDEITIKFIDDNGRYDTKKGKWQEDIDYVIFSVE